MLHNCNFLNLCVVGCFQLAVSFIANAHLKNAQKINCNEFFLKGWAYNVSKSAVVTASRCMSSSESPVTILCLCPSVAATPILKGCSEKELEEMREQVGGIMTIDQVRHCNFLEGTQA